MRNMLWSLAIGVMLAASGASAAPTTLVSQGSLWNYAPVGADLWSNWGFEGYGSFAWGSANWSSGNAAFGNGGSSLPVATYWAAGTDLALQTIYNLSGTINGNLTLNVASDNGFMVFVNGTQVAKANAEGYTSYWEYSLSVSPSVFAPGTNFIEVLAEDHGGLTFFDMELKGDITTSVVPAPGALVLASLGLGLVSWVKRRFA